MAFFKKKKKKNAVRNAEIQKRQKKNFCHGRFLG